MQQNTLHEILDKLMDKICNSNVNNAHWITVYIKNYTKLHCHILVFVLKSHSQIIRKKGGKKVMHCWDSNQRPDLREVEKKKENALPRLEAATSDLRRQCSNHYTMETSHPNVFKICPLYTNSVLYSWRLHWHEVRVR